MIELMIWMGAILIVGVAIYSIIYDQRKRAQMTEEEYEARARQGPSLLSVGVLALDQVLRPEIEKAVAFQKDTARGQVADKESGKSLADLKAEDLGKTTQEM